MPYELILSTNTLDEGRIKINNFFNTASAGLFTGSTGVYSIVSTALENYASGPTSFIVGRKNSGTTYGSILGGTENYTNSSNVFIGNGYRNKIKTSVNNYGSILNGKYNYIYNNAGGFSSYNTILAGYKNKITKNYRNTIINGTLNVVEGSDNTVVGFKNFIKNLSSTGAYSNLINGRTNYISGSTLVNTNFINGIANRLNNYVGGLGGNAKHNFMNGKFNSIYKGSYCFFNGWGIHNRDQYSTPKNHVIAFGKGNAAFSSSNLRPLLSYSMIMGFNTRKVRFEFGPSPNAYLAAGAWNNTGADYGEYFEWLDKNLNKDQRVGYFVELENGKIIIAKSQNVIGVISNSTAFIGDSNQDYWSEMYLKDEWGVEIKQTFAKYNFEIKNSENIVIDNKEIYFDENNVCFEQVPDITNPLGVFSKNFIKENGTFIENIQFPLVNPQFDKNKNYIPRKNRNEWDVVGLLGKLRVRTSEQITGNFVDVDTNTGMAKNGTTYPVLKKFKDFDGNYGIVLIFFK